MEDLIGSKDWSATPLGDRSQWPSTLVTLLNVMLSSRFPMFLFWGPELISFYNDAFKPSLGVNGKHPHILGMPARLAWAEIWDVIKPLLDEALADRAVWREDLLVPFYRNGRIEDIYWTFSYSAIKEENGTTSGVLVICNETTEKIRNTQLAKESETRFRNIVHQTPIGITIFHGHDFVVGLANQMYLDIVDKKEEDLVGKRFFDVFPELRNSVHGLLTEVLKTGIPYYGRDFHVSMLRSGKPHDAYFNFVYYPLRDDKGSISGIIVVAAEVTSEVMARFKIQESESKFRELVMRSPSAMTIFKGEDFVIDLANTMMLERIWRRKEEEVMGRPLLEAFPELSDQRFPALLKKVYSQGEIHTEKEAIAHVNGDDGLRRFVLDFEYTPLMDSRNKVWGIIATVNDVTEKFDARKKIEESEERLNIVIDASELGTWEVNFKTKEVWYSNRYLQILGYNEKVHLTHEQILKHLHPDDQKVREDAYKQAMETGYLDYTARLIWSDGSVHWMEGKGRVFFDEKKNPVRMLGTVRDITEERSQKETLEKSEQKFRLLAQTMPQLVWTASADGVFTYCNELLETFSQTTDEDLNWIVALHAGDRMRTAKAWKHAVATGDNFLIEHRFKRPDGKYYWQLSRATAQRDSAGNVVTWVGTSTDIHAQKTFAHELEKQVQERTGELAETNANLERMNEELKSFAYVSSHDLQEPLRKIQTFASRIREREKLSAKGSDDFAKIEKSAHQMQVLIQDLLAYSRTSKMEPAYENVSLGALVAEVQKDFHEMLVEKKASIESDDLPELRLIRVQFKQVLYNLVSNSLKFARTDVLPRIRISAQRDIDPQDLDGKLNAPASPLIRISVSDNGIGFDPQYRERIFEVFQRLHGKHEYSGTGVGLAIVKKIVENHRGYIEAHGIPGEGSRFDIYLPFGDSGRQ